jgi:RNA polymerase sigma-70 factor (ECF subfamily)
MGEVDDTAVRPARLGLRPLSDDDLLRRLRAGDPSALGDLYDRFAPLVHGLALRVTAERAAAESVTEAVFLAAWERPHRCAPTGTSLAAWLGAEAHRRAVEHVRRRPRPGTDVAAPAPLGGAEPVLAALAKVPDDQRSALLLAYFGGRTYRQVAEVLGIGDAAARDRLAGALQQMADALGAEGMLP